MGRWPLLALQVLGAADPDLWQRWASQEKWSYLQPRWFRLQFHQFSNDLDLYFHFLLKTKQHGHAGEESTSCNLNELKFRFVRTFKGIKQSTVKSILSCHPNHHWQKWSDLIQGPLRWGCGQKQSCSSVLSPQSGRNGQAAFHGW